MHSEATVASVLELHQAGLNNCEISRRTGVPRPTIRDWVGGMLPRSYASARSRGLCGRCGGNEHRFDRLSTGYVYLLGMYLGDGCISAHRRGVHRLRVSLDKKYPRIVEECVESMQVTVPDNRVHVLLTPSNCYSVSAYSRSWPCLFPQHGPGMKHTRPIFLAEWQQELAKRWPEQLLKGLIHSDGCRSFSTGRGGWTQPRYVFSNVSTDITSIFCSACDCLGLRWTAAFPKSETAAVAIYVSRKADVAKLDEFVGPKR
jgi:hypothetical protein